VRPSERIGQFYGLTHRAPGSPAGRGFEKHSHGMPPNLLAHYCWHQYLDECPPDRGRNPRCFSGLPYRCGFPQITGTVDLTDEIEQTLAMGLTSNSWAIGRDFSASMSCSSIRSSF